MINNVRGTSIQDVVRRNIILHICVRQPNSEIWKGKLEYPRDEFIVVRQVYNNWNMFCFIWTVPWESGKLVSGWQRGRWDINTLTR